MASVTYVTYNEGIDAKRLHLGNLVHDFKNPALYEPYIDKTYTEWVILRYQSSETDCVTALMKRPQPGHAREHLPTSH